jgi:hypothetical protein
MDREQVKEHFRRQVHEYEAFMCRIVPAYEFQTELLIDLIPFDTTAPIRVLDLGSGPGTLSEKVLERFRSTAASAPRSASGTISGLTRCRWRSPSESFQGRRPQLTASSSCMQIN